MRRSLPVQLDAPEVDEVPAGTPSASAVRRDALRTEFDVLHRHGTMRLATARDELLPLYDARVQENPAYTTVVLLSRVITSLGTLGAVTQSVVENMFASDVAFLQDLYRRINAEGHTRAAVTCPSCQHRFDVDISGGRLGES